jgi:glycerate 2-kinase
LKVSKIKNRRSLLSVGNKRERRIILDCFEAALRAVSPSTLIERELNVSSSSQLLKVPRAGLEFDLSRFRKVIVIGGGKASGYLAEGLEKKIGKFITEGYVNILEGTRRLFHTKKIVLNEASHPIPDQSGVNGTRKMLELLSRADRSSLIICLISGGGSALVPLPAKGITLKEKIMTTELLLRSGANIDQINRVRKHISGVKGGQLVRHGNGATFLSLIISDVVGDHLDSIASGPTVPDSSTFFDAEQILSDLKILDLVPGPVRERILLGCKGLIPETPKPNDPIFGRVSNVIIGSNSIACNAIQNLLKKKLGRSVDLSYLGSSVIGEARNVARTLVTRSLRYSKNSERPYFALVWGGETTVTVRGNGIGGRNQEEAISVLLNLGNAGESSDLTFGFIGTDGIDGETNAAGALIDFSTHERAKKVGLDARKYLENNDSNTFFKKVGSSLIITGPTGTNVNDVGMAISRKKKNGSQ